MGPALASESPQALLKGRDYTIIFGKTIAEPLRKPPGFEERWQQAQQAISQLAKQCEALDPDGITLYVASDQADQTLAFRKYTHVTSFKLQALIAANYPPTSLYLKPVLQDALDGYFARKAVGQTKPNGEIILVLLDGEPCDRANIAKLIMQASHQLDRDEELGIGFVQIGDDFIARGFLTALDDNLQEFGAKFDIVDTKALENIQPDSLLDFLKDVIHD
ncbi:MAG: hypothetical protein AAFV72_22435 [Cyanobacteria bacterium J06635_1]